MRGAPLTVPEARVILRADEALDLTYEARLAAGTTFGAEEHDAWAALVQSATDRLAAFEKTKHAAGPAAPTPVTAEPTPYPGGNEPDFQTLAIEAVARASLKPMSEAEAEARALRTGIETIVRVFGTNSAEWAQQFRGLLERVPGARRSA